MCKNWVTPNIRKFWWLIVGNTCIWLNYVFSYHSLLVFNNIMQSQWLLSHSNIPTDVHHQCTGQQFNTHTFQRGKIERRKIKPISITYTKKRHGALKTYLKAGLRHTLTVNGRCSTFELWYWATKTAVTTLFCWL